jgi:hypothetical protein
MCCITGRRIVSVLVVAASALGLAVGAARAQCHGCVSMGRPAFGMSPRPILFQPSLPPSSMAALGLQQGVVLAAMQQQQNALAAGWQLQQQQNAVAAALQVQRQQPQNGVLAVRQLGPRNAGEAPRPVLPRPEQKEAVPPLDREEAAARRVMIANQLASDASRTRRAGEADRAARMFERVGEHLKEVVEKYPQTQAAGEAAALLEKLGL